PMLPYARSETTLPCRGAGRRQNSQSRPAPRSARCCHACTWGIAKTRRPSIPGASPAGESCGDVGRRPIPETPLADSRLRRGVARRPVSNALPGPALYQHCPCSKLTGEHYLPPVSSPPCCTLLALSVGARAGFDPSNTSRQAHNEVLGTPKQECRG